jgi:hypothetical protein
MARVSVTNMTSETQYPNPLLVFPAVGGPDYACLPFRDRLAPFEAGHASGCSGSTSETEKPPRVPPGPALIEILTIKEVARI